MGIETLDYDALIKRASISLIEQIIDSRPHSLLQLFRHKKVKILKFECLSLM